MPHHPYHHVVVESKQSVFGSHRLRRGTGRAVVEDLAVIIFIAAPSSRPLRFWMLFFVAVAVNPLACDYLRFPNDPRPWSS